jgi:ADP-ribosyl-[dinitrogen reductase] hydrolase
MALCLADSLLQEGGFCGSSARLFFWQWWFEGCNNAFRHDRGKEHSVGLGGNISQSLYCMRPGERPPPEYGAAGEDSGIGSIMRLAPVPIFFSGSLPDALEFARRSSRTTHPGDTAAEACAFLAFLLHRALNRGKGRACARTFVKEAADAYVEE